MSLTVGSRLGHYDVTALIGKGARCIEPETPSCFLVDMPPSPLE